MKAILEFDLPDDDEWHMNAIQGAQWRAALWQLDQKLRKIEKHGEGSEDASTVREWIQEAMADNGVSFD